MSLYFNLFNIIKIIQIQFSYFFTLFLSIDFYLLKITQSLWTPNPPHIYIYIYNVISQSRTTTNSHIFIDKSSLTGVFLQCYLHAFLCFRFVYIYPYSTRLPHVRGFWSLYADMPSILSNSHKHLYKSRITISLNCLSKINYLLYFIQRYFLLFCVPPVYPCFRIVIIALCYLFTSRESISVLLLLV